MKNKNILVWVVIIVLIIIWGVSAQVKNSRNSETIKIGDLSASTGAFAVAGEMLNNSAKIAVEEINANGGINGRMLEVLTENTENDSQKSVSAYQNLKLKGVHYFIGEGSPIVSSVRPLAIADKNLIMSSAAIASSYTDDNPLSCRFSLTPPNIAQSTMSLLKKNGYKNVSFLLPDSEYGQALYGELKKLNTEGGISFSNVEFYVVGTSGDYRTNITKIVAGQNKTDVLILMNNSSTLEPMLKQLKLLGWTKPIISDNATINNPTLKDLTLVNGIEYIDYEYSRLAEATDSTETKNFKDKYRALAKSDPVYIPAGHYDAIKLLAYAISKVGDDPQKVAKFISNLKDYQGITGSLSFNSDCEATRKDFYRKVVDGKFVEVK
jgi:branched-chain amino acid transport system substrate-binding protein